MEALEAEKAKRAPAGEDVKQSLKERAAKIEKLQARIHEIEDRMFDEFSEKVICPVLPNGTSCHSYSAQRQFLNIHVVLNEKSCNSCLHRSAQRQLLHTSVSAHWRIPHSCVVTNGNSCRPVFCPMANPSDLSSAQWQILHTCVLPNGKSRTHVFCPMAIPASIVRLNGNSCTPVLLPNGESCAFESPARSLVPDKIVCAHPCAWALNAAHYLFEI